MRPTTKRSWVLCEGADDSRVMESLAQHIGIADRLHFEHYAQSGFHAFLKTLRSRPEFTSGAISSILVTKDADLSFEAAWQSLSDGASSIFSVNLSKPGAWTTSEFGLRFAGWIIPGPGKAGMIETLCLEAAREEHQEIFNCIDSFVDCVSSAQGASLHEKARFHIWTILAQQPGAQDRLSLKRALEHMPPNWDAACFTELKEILRSTAGA